MTYCAGREFSVARRFAVSGAAFVCWLLTVAAAATSADCLDADSLKALDYRYEQAIRTGDVAFLEALLAENFVWIHNHAAQFETRDQLLARLGEGYQPLKAREQSGVQVRRLRDTAVIHGATTVDQFAPDDHRRANRYQFIRTYVKTPAGCKLLAGQTMKVWSTTEPLK